MVINKLKMGILAIGISSFLSAAYVDVVDQNIVIQSSSEQGIVAKRSGTIGSATDPIFTLGRIVAGGDNSPNFRVLYSDSSTSETPVFNFDNKGIFASIQRGGTGSSFEAYLASGDTYPYFRIRSDVAQRLSFGGGGSTYDNDVDFRRSGTGKAGVAIGSNVEFEVSATEISVNKPLKFPILTSHPSAPGSGYMLLYFYSNGTTTEPYMQDSAGNKTAIH